MGLLLCDGFVRTMFPSSPILRKPVEFVKGLSLFATQTTVWSLMLLYHMAKYHVEFVSVKKPKAKTWLGDTKVWLVKRICVEVKVSAESEIVVCDARKQRRKNKKPGMFAERGLMNEMKCLVKERNNNNNNGSISWFWYCGG